MAFYGPCTDVPRPSQALALTFHGLPFPPPKVFDLFESVLLLSVGATFYFGPAKTLPASLAAQGFACKPNYNPADYVMFLLQTEPPESLKALAAKFRAGADRDAPVGVASESVAVHIERRKRSAGILTEIYYLAQREKNTLLRDRAGLIATIMAPSLLNLLFALIFFQAGDRSKSTYSINTHFGAITQIAIGGMFGASQPLLLKFPLEAALFKREYGVGAYSATTYFLSKTVVELPKVSPPDGASRRGIDWSPSAAPCPPAPTRCSRRSLLLLSGSPSSSPRSHGSCRTGSLTSRAPSCSTSSPSG